MPAITVSTPLPGPTDSTQNDDLHKCVMLAVVVMLFPLFPGAFARVFTPIIGLWQKLFVP